MNYCLYYQALVDRKQTWFVMSVVRAEENVCFPRTLDKQASLLEFFVPEGQEKLFLKIMDALQGRNLVTDLKKLPNRLEAGHAF